MGIEADTGPSDVGEEDAASSIREKLQADLAGVGAAVASCKRCPGGGRGVPGCGDPGAGLFLVAGRPGPGATAGNPWGAWRDRLLEKAAGDWGWDLAGAYYSTALRCPLQRVARLELRRCSGFLADEFFIVGPRLVVVSGKVATVAMREALGDAIPTNPRAGDVCTFFDAKFLFELDIARIDKDRKAEAVFWNILRSAEDIFPDVKGD